MKTRYVVKIGSSLLTDDKGHLNKKYLSNLVASLSKLMTKDKELIIVTSGAVATGVGLLNMKFSPRNIPEKQALASIGQVELMNEYKKLFNKYKKIIAQVLLTRLDMQKEDRYLNIRNTILTLLEKNVIPIINENDTVSSEEIKFGDNDCLAALVASKTSADYLIIFTDVEGLYTSNPKENKKASLISKVDSFDNLENLCSSKPGSNRGTGGMQSKINAAKIACSSGVKVIVAKGDSKYVLDNISKTENLGTLFVSNNKIKSQRKKWLAYLAKPEGIIVVDDGAKKAILEKHKSLLSIGITKVVGNFSRGDVVILQDKDGNKFANGITFYSSQDLEKIKGLKTEDIKKILGYENYDDVINRDNLVLSSVN
jgi:glutamate 5-kinase